MLKPENSTFLLLFSDRDGPGDSRVAAEEVGAPKSAEKEEEYSFPVVNGQVQRPKDVDPMKLKPSDLSSYARCWINAAHGKLACFS
jgi:hypothetical protein